jgi:hypothetical protein
MRNLRAFHDFLYLVQYRSHTPSTLAYLDEALDKFHATKAIYIEKGVRRGTSGTIHHFHIPKLAGLHAYSLHIPQMGTSPQYSTEITEACHQPMAKQAYRATNHKDYVKQMCRFLDRNEKIAFRRELLAWVEVEIPRQRIIANTIGFSPGYQQHSLDMLKMMQESAARLRMGQKQDIKRGLWLNKIPKHIYNELASLKDVYSLPDLDRALRAAQQLGPNVVSILKAVLQSHAHYS